MLVGRVGRKRDRAGRPRNPFGAGGLCCSRSPAQRQAGPSTGHEPSRRFSSAHRSNHREEGQGEVCFPPHGHTAVRQQVATRDRLAARSRPLASSRRPRQSWPTTVPPAAGRPGRATLPGCRPVVRDKRPGDRLLRIPALPAVERAACRPRVRVRPDPLAAPDLGFQDWAAKRSTPMDRAAKQPATRRSPARAPPHPRRSRRRREQPQGRAAQSERYPRAVRPRVPSDAPRPWRSKPRHPHLSCRSSVPDRQRLHPTQTLHR